MFSLFKLPGHCLLCSSSTHEHSICQHCTEALSLIRQPCQRCALPLMGAEIKLCGACQKTPPHFNRCIAPFSYASPIKQLVTGLKHHQRLAYGRLLGELLGEAIAAAYSTQPLPQIIIPVPLHLERLRERGFNQSLEIAKYLRRKLPCKDRMPINQQLVQRFIATPNQQGLTAIERKRNLRGAFQLSESLQKNAQNPDNAITGKHIALLDDVVTTASTVDEISRVLLEAGAKEVHIWAVARTLNQA